MGDGGDNFCLSRRAVIPKDMLNKRLLPIGSYFVNVLQPGLKSHSYAYYYLEHKVQEACIEVSDKVLQRLGLYEKKLTTRVNICTDNTSKEAKNRFMPGYLHNLVENKLPSLVMLNQRCESSGRSWFEP